MNTKTFNPLSASFTIWSNTLQQFVGNLPTNRLSAFDHFVKLALKGLNHIAGSFPPFGICLGLIVN